MHALHTVHALPDLRVAGGRLGDVSLAQDCDHFGVVFDDRKSDSCAPETAHAVTVKCRRLKLTAQPQALTVSSSLYTLGTRRLLVSLID